MNSLFYISFFYECTDLNECDKRNAELDVRWVPIVYERKPMIHNDNNLEEIKECDEDLESSFAKDYIKRKYRNKSSLITDDSDENSNFP